jgi:hypothetical protein
LEASAVAVVFEDWRNQHELVNYPFADWATLKQGEPEELPHRLFVDARLYPIGGGEDIYLARIESSELDGTVSLYDGYGRPAGVMVCTVEIMRSLGNWASGSREFSYEDTGFAPVVTVPTPQIGVRGFILESGEFFTGDFWLVGESGVYFTVEDGNIRVDLVGDTMSKKRLCEQLNAYGQPWFIKSLNMVGPSKYGDFKLLSGTALSADTALRFVPSENGITIELAGDSIHAAN